MLVAMKTLISCAINDIILPFATFYGQNSLNHGDIYSLVKIEFYSNLREVEEINLSAMKLTSQGAFKNYVDKRM